MKRILLATTLAATMTSAFAQKLQVIELGDPTPNDQGAKKGAEQIEQQKKASEIPASEALTFIKELESTVDRGMALLATGRMTSSQGASQARALATLETEGAKFGVLFTPFHKCNEAGIDALSAWQGVVNGDQKQFEKNHMSYVDNLAACEVAAED